MARNSNSDNIVAQGNLKPSKSNQYNSKKFKLWVLEINLAKALLNLKHFSYHFYEFDGNVRIFVKNHGY